MVCKMCERFVGTWELMSHFKDDGKLNVTFYGLPVSLNLPEEEEEEPSSLMSVNVFSAMLKGLNSCTSQCSTPSDVNTIMPVKDEVITRRDLKCLPKPRLTIRTEGAWMRIKMENPVKKTEISFKLGQEFEEITADNRKTKSIVTMEKDGSLLHVQIWHGKKTLIRRRLVYGIMVEELIVGSAIHKRQYKRA